jgi:hypothetical protein
MKGAARRIYACTAVRFPLGCDLGATMGSDGIFNRRDEGHMALGWTLSQVYWVSLTPLLPSPGTDQSSEVTG